MTDDRIREFIAECRERLINLDQALVELEDNPEGDEIVDSIYRDLHTIKGNCGFFGFDELQSVTHSAESLVSLVRDDDLPATEAIVDALLRTIDASRTILESIDESGDEPGGDWEALIATLDRLHEKPSSLGEPPPADEAPAGSETLPPDEAPADRRASPDDAPDTSGPSGPNDEAGTSSRHTIRVDVDLLDDLMNQMSELILTRNQLQQQAARRGHDSTSQGPLRQLDLVTTQLQHSVMQARMQPIRRVWNRLPRMVRDLAHEQDKQIELELDGGDTELDKNLVELITDPVTHLVRNAIDHGLETPDERERVDKPKTGTVHLRAYQERGQVVVQISDDGRGIDTQVVAERAVEQGLCTPDDAERLSDDQLYKLLFEPGFSTRSTVTDTSGRGVGLDVVQRNIERAGGSIHVDSTPGAGTVMELHLPLTLAVVSALTIRCGGQQFVLPQDNVIRLARPGNAEDRETSLNTLYETPVYHHRDELLPVVFLDRLLGFDDRPPAERIQRDEPVSLVLLRAERTRFALVVDQVLDTEEHVVKSLPRLLRSIGIYTGATIRGDGRAMMILDPTGIVERANLSEETSHLGLETSTSEPTTADSAAEAAESSPHADDEILWCRSRDDGRIALPLTAIERLEQIRRDEIDRRGEIGFVRYHGELLPLVEIEEVLPERRSEPRNEEIYRRAIEQTTLPVVIYRWRERTVGLVLTEFLEILTTDLDDQYGVSRPGVAYCTDVRGHITEVLDVPAILETSPLTSPSS